MGGDNVSHLQRGSTMDLSSTYTALLNIKLLPVDYQGRPLLDIIDIIETEAVHRPIFRIFFKLIDETVLNWFDKALDITETDNALFDEDMVAMSRYILTSRLADRAKDCEICDDTVICARRNVNMAEQFGVNQWWMM